MVYKYILKPSYKSKQLKFEIEMLHYVYKINN